MKNYFNISRKNVLLFSILLFGLMPYTCTAQNDTMKNIEAPSTPQTSLQRLMEGNKRFANDKTTCPESHQMRRAGTVAKQKPFAIVLGCADSRIPPELAFDQGIGDIFVVRVAGNVVSNIEMESLEYSAVYNQSSIIVVLGHQNCGAVSAVLQNQTKDIETIASLIQAALKKSTKDSSKSKPELREAVEINVKNSVDQIRKNPVIANLIQLGKIDVVGGYYNLDSGVVDLLQ